MTIIMEDMYSCNWLRNAEKSSGFRGEIGLFQEKKEDKYCIIAALHTDTSRHILTGGTHYGLLGKNEDWPTLDSAVNHIAIKADDMGRKLLVSGLSEAHNADGAKFAIVCFQPLTPRERADAFRFLGRLSVDLSNYLGKYVLAAGDVGTKPGDLSFAALATPAAFNHIAGQSPEYGGIGDTGLPTAKGVMEAIELAFRIYWKDSSWTKTMAVNGLGSVGGALVREAVKRRWSVVVADTNSQKINELQASLLCPVHVVESSGIHKEPVTMFVPCAVHPFITNETIAEFRCKMIMSAQNNDVDPKEALALAAALHARGIEWAPGYANNHMGIAMILRQKDLVTFSYDAIFCQEIAAHQKRMKTMFMRAKEKNMSIFTVIEELMQ